MTPDTLFSSWFEKVKKNVTGKLGVMVSGHRRLTNEF